MWWEVGGPLVHYSSHPIYKDRFLNRNQRPFTPIPGVIFGRSEALPGLISVDFGGRFGRFGTKRPPERPKLTPGIGVNGR